MVVVDKLTKATHFIPVKSMYKMTNIADIYMQEITKLHKVPKAIISDRDPRHWSMMIYLSMKWKPHILSRHFSPS